MYGYGAKGFMHSMIETATEVTSDFISTKDIQQSIALGKEMTNYPIEVVLPDVCHVLLDSLLIESIEQIPGSERDRIDQPPRSKLKASPTKLVAQPLLRWSLTKRRSTTWML